MTKFLISVLVSVGNETLISVLLWLKNFDVSMGIIMISVWFGTNIKVLVRLLVSVENGWYQCQYRHETRVKYRYLVSVWIKGISIWYWNQYEFRKSVSLWIFSMLSVSRYQWMTRTGQVRTGWVRTGPDRTGWVRAGRVRTGRVRTGQGKKHCWT